METTKDFIGMWSEDLAKAPESKYEIRGQFLYFKVKDICSDPYRTEYIGNNHSDRRISCTVVTLAIYMGEVINVEKKDVVIRPGPDNEIKLGCNGWKNPTGADTEYRRHFENPQWA